MYTIKCDDKYLHKPDANLFVLSGKCTMEVNKTGSLIFYIQQEHPNIDSIKLLKSEIIMHRDGVPMWYGRPLNFSFDIDGLMCVECEGELAYLLDTNMRRRLWYTKPGNINPDTAVRDLWHDTVWSHNHCLGYNATNPFPDDVDPSLKIFPALETITVKDSNGYVSSQSNYESTLDYINNKIIPRFGGYMKVTRNDEGKRLLNYLADFEVNTSQTIELGKNIINLEKSIKGEGLYTALIPLGAKLDESSSSERRVTIAELSDSVDGTIVKKNDFIYDTEAVEKYGVIFGTERWDDVTIAENLLKKAKEKLKENCKEKTYLKMTAIDLHNVDVNIDALEVGTKIRCISKYHDIDEYMIIKSMQIDIDNPANSSVELVQSIDNKSNESSLTEQKNNDDSVIDDSNIDEFSTNDDIIKLQNWCKDTFTPKVDDGSGTPVDLSDYAKTADVNSKINDLKDWTNTNYTSKTDLSEYAKIADVNTAFNELATALGGL